MTADPIFDKVRLLVQGANLSNLGAPPAGADPGVGVVTISTVPASPLPPTGADHVVMADYALTFEGDSTMFKRVTEVPVEVGTSQLVEFTGCFELDIELNAAWPAGVVIAKMWGTTLTVESPGVIRWTDTYAEFSGGSPATGTVSIGADTTRLKVGMTFNNVDYDTLIDGTPYPAFPGRTGLNSTLHFKRPDSPVVTVSNYGASVYTEVKALKVNDDTSPATQAVTKFYGARITDLDDRLNNSGDLLFDGPPWPEYLIPPYEPAGGGEFIPVPALWEPTYNTANVTLSLGGTKARLLSAADGVARTTVGKTTGQWYFEVDVSSTAGDSGAFGSAGVFTTDGGPSGWTALSTGFDNLGEPGDTSVLFSDGERIGGLDPVTDPIPVVGVWFDADSRRFKIRISDRLTQSFDIPGTGPIFGMTCSGGANFWDSAETDPRADGPASAIINAGQTQFVYAPPPGSRPLAEPSTPSLAPVYLKFEDGAGSATVRNLGVLSASYAVAPHSIVTTESEAGTGSLLLTGVTGDVLAFGDTGQYAWDDLYDLSGVTTEMWVMFPSLGAGWRVFAGNELNGGLSVHADGRIAWDGIGCAGMTISSAAGAITAGTWYHVALVWAYNEDLQDFAYTLYLDGAAVGKAALVDESYYDELTDTDIAEFKLYIDDVETATFTSVTDMLPVMYDIGGYKTGAAAAVAYIDEYRWSNEAVYSAEFSPVSEYHVAPSEGPASVDVTMAGIVEVDSHIGGGTFVATLILQDAEYSGATELHGILPGGTFIAAESFAGDTQLDDALGRGYVNAWVPPPIVLPVFRVTANARHMTDGVVAMLPRITVSAASGSATAASLPSIEVVASGTTVMMALFTATLPSMEVVAVGRVSEQSTVQVSLPGLEAVAFGGAQAVMTLPVMTGSASVVVGAVAHATVALPRVMLTAGGYREDTSRADIVLPALVAAPSSTAYITLPLFTTTSRANPVVAVTFEAYTVNMNQPLDDNPRNNFEAKVKQVTRYTNWPFIQVVRLGYTYYGVAEDGLYELGGTTDDGTPITWTFETCKTDFGDPHKKTVASAYVGGQAGGEVAYTLRSGDDADRMYEYTTTRIMQKRNHRQKFGLGRRARYYSFGLSGTGKIAMDMLELELANTTRRI